MKSLTDFEKTIEYKSISNLIDRYGDVDLYVVEKNKTGLGELFQFYIDKFSANKSDYVLFMHDDLEVHDQYLFEKLKKAHEEYDIVGIAGSTYQDYTQNKPLAWHLCQKDRSDGRGFVSHFIPQGVAGNAHYNSAYFGPTPAEVCVIDGLFMSFKMSKIPKDYELFDKDFTFHFYDMSMAVNAKLRDMKIGVWPIFCIHHGLGEFANDPCWKKLMPLFKRRYGNWECIIK